MIHQDLTLQLINRKVVSIPLYFFLYYIYQAGTISWLALFFVIPFIFSIDKRYIAINSIVVFVSSFMFYFFNYRWFSSFNNYSIYLVCFIYPIFRHTVPYIIVSILYKRGLIYSGLLIASVFTIFEYITSTIPFPFPYGLMALGLFSNNILLQILDITGQFGLTFIIYFINYLLLCSFRNLIKKDYRNSIRNFSIFLSVATIWVGYGFISRGLLNFEELVYIDLAQTSIKSADKVKLTKDDYFKYIESFIKRKSSESDIVLFPETFIYSSVDNSKNKLNEYLIELSGKYDVTIAVGFLEDTKDPPYNRYNSFITMSSNSNNTVSRKTVLAPFGEYYPFGNFFPNLKKLLRERHGAYFFNRGKGLTKHTYKDKNSNEMEFVPLICFEAAFSSLLNKVDLSDTDFLVNVSSDLWTNSYKGMIHNSMFSKFRAIEYRKPVVRVSNGGLSGYVSASGKTWLPIPAFFEGNSHVKLAKANHKIYKKRTPYSYIGDMIIPISFLLVMFYLIKLRRSKR